MLPDDAKARKERPIATGVIDYFKDALVEVAHVSFVGNKQHNGDGPLRWDRSKSGDESDALMRHFLERGTIDSDGLRHSAKLAWRSLAYLQKELEAAAAAGASTPPGAMSRGTLPARCLLTNAAGSLCLHSEGHLGSCTFFLRDDREADR